MYRALHPDDFDRTRESERLDLLAVLTQRVFIMQVQLGHYVAAAIGANFKVPTDMPSSFEDLLDKPQQSTDRAEAEILAAMAAFDRLIGR